MLRLRHWEGRGFDEIALEIGKSEAAVRKIWYRSLQRLGEIVRSDAALAADGDAGARRPDRQRGMQPLGSASDAALPRSGFSVLDVLPGIVTGLEGSPRSREVLATPFR